MKSIPIIVFILFLAAIYLRYDYVKDKPLWVDEVKTASVAHYGSIYQSGGRELLQVLYYRLFGIDSDLGLRLPIIVLSSFTIIALLWVCGLNALPFAFLIALHPFFIHWGSLARPYALAGFFVVLGVKNKWFYILSVLCTPFAITGIYLGEIKGRIFFYAFLLIIAIAWYRFMPLSQADHFNIDFLINAKRLWYIPIISCIIHLINGEKIYANIRTKFAS